MRELHTSTAASLDGFHEIDGGLSFAHAYEQDPEWDRYANEMFGSYDTLLAGRRTYLRYKQYQASDEAAPSQEIMSRQKHVVISNTLSDNEVGGAVRYRDDLVGNVQALKEQPGGNILCIGGTGVRTQLLNAGLIDRVKIWYVPVALGNGRPVFEGITAPISLKLMRSYAFHNGLTRLEYQVVSPKA